MNKKAEELELNYYMLWIPRIFFVAVLTISIGLLINRYVNFRINVQQPEAIIFADAVGVSPELMFVDQTGRVHPYFVDLAKLNSPDAILRLEKALDFGPDHLSANITLTWQSSKQSIIYNSNLFRILQIKHQAWFTGAEQYIFLKPVLVKDGDSYIRGNLRIEVLS